MELWYDVLDLEENKIGYYHYQINQPKTDQSEFILIDAEIHFKIKKFFFPLYKYEYKDTARLVGKKLESYHIEENRNGSKTIVDAQSTDTNLNISIQKGSRKSVVSIDHSEYEASMFHFRFPTSVEKIRSFDKKQSRILIPLEGKVKQYHFSTTKEENLTWNGKTIKVVKMTSKTDDDQTLSWINSEGITIYLKTKTYIMSLTTREKALADI